MISVIIPTINEEKTIARVVSLALRAKAVTEVIVIDDKSLDRTVEAAKEAGVHAGVAGVAGGEAFASDGLFSVSLEALRTAHEAWMPGYMNAPKA